MHKLHCVTVLFNFCNNPPRLCCSYLNFQTKKLKHSGLFKLKSSWLTGSSTCIQTQPTVLLLFSLSAVSSSLWPHRLQHVMLPCPSISPRVCSNSSIELVMPSNHLVLCHPLLLTSIFPSIRVFSNELALRIRWPKYWSFSFSISPSSEYSGLISFRMDWFDSLAIQGTLKSLLQLHSSKASILQHSVFFIAQLSHPYMTTVKNIALTI